MAHITRCVAIAVTSLALLGACAVSGLNFEQDERLEIVSPEDRAKVTPPVTIEWRVEDFRITGRDGSRRSDAGYFGVYVDRPPQPPGETQESLVRDTESCRTDPECPSRSYLDRQNIHATTETSFTIERLVDPDPDDDRREMHEVTIVFLNGRGERIGESAFTVEFEVERPGS